jgi:hypothetical protein
MGGHPFFREIWFIVDGGGGIVKKNLLKPRKKP